jgi:recombination protein RecT
MAENTQQMAKQANGLTPTGAFAKLVEGDWVQEQLKSILKENASIFAASLVELFAGDTNLQKCNQGLVVKEALKAASLQLPLSKALGFAWVIARWSSKDNAYVPAFQPGYRAFKQLALRTAQYRYINCGPVYEGELKKWDKLSGALDITGEAASDKVIGFFGYFKMLNGFEKSSYWTSAKVEQHAIKYNEQCKKAGKLTGIWAEHFDTRAQETVLKLLISKDGLMSIDMQQVSELIDKPSSEEAAAREVAENANIETIGFTASEVINTNTGEVTEIGASAEPSMAVAGPSF